MPIGATIAAGAATLGGAALTSSAASGAAHDAQEAASKNLAFNNMVYTNAQGYLNPSVNIGNEAGSELEGLLGIGGNPGASNAAFNKYLDSTNYKFVLGQGLNGVKTANAMDFDSGATAKALNNYAQGEAGNTLQGYEQMLGGEQGLGVQAGSALAGVGTNIAAQNASANNSAASAAGAAGLVSANAAGNAFSGLSSYLNQQRAQSSFAPGQGSGIPSDLEGLI